LKLSNDLVFCGVKISLVHEKQTISCESNIHMNAYKDKI